MNLLRISAVAAGFVLTLGAAAQTPKKALDHDVYDGWQRVAATVITPDGKYLSWTVNPQEGDGTLYIRNIATGRTLEIPRGNGLSISPDSDWAYCRIRPEFATTRKAKIDKKKKDDMPKDSLAVIRLSDFSVVKYKDVESFKTGHDSMPFAAYKYKKGVVVVNPASGSVDTLKNASSYVFSRDGKSLAVTLEKDKKDSLSFDAIVLCDLSAGRRDTLSRDLPFYGSMNFDRSSRKLVFLSSSDTLEDASRHCAVNVYSDGILSELVPASYKGSDGLIVNENADPFFSVSGDRVFLGLGEYIPPKDSTLYDFETALVDIWNYDAFLTPPQQRIKEKQIKNKTYLSVVNGGEVVRLAGSFFDEISLTQGGDGDWALSVDNTAYRLTSAWDSNEYTDVSLVSLKDGSRREVLHKVSGTPEISPEGKYLYWYDCDDWQWHTYKVATGEQFNLTADCRTAFYDEENDRPMFPEPYDYRPEWTEGDEYVLINDRYDLFRFAPDGSSIQKLTDGRPVKVQFRHGDPVDHGFTAADQRLGLGHPYSAKDRIWLTSFSETTKENGYGYVDGFSGKVKTDHFLDGYSFGSPVVAEKADVIAFTKGNFRTPANLYVSPGALRRQTLQSRVASASRLSKINPQQTEYRWGDVELVHWTAYDGTPLDGLMFIPEGIAEGEKVPLMVYFYEKNSETMFSPRTPAPSRSVVNVPMYVSNGYAVFIPDVVYKTGHPGESAYNCIVSGTEAMCDRYGFIDRDRMAIQGQSWGGYQVAYLITRTNLYKAAGAGAPVGNMTSAYGGIRWESGHVRAMQYEHGQSRIGKSIWDEGGLDLYIENSPIFHVDKVQTPVLIMANDNDGAVPWYQGIEFFSDLRRFQKPAWLLQYNKEAHNLVERRNCKDLSIRLQQFFDHYLKGAPMPAWMKHGVPVWKKDRYFGFENAE